MHGDVCEVMATRVTTWKANYVIYSYLYIYLFIYLFIFKAKDPCVLQVQCSPCHILFRSNNGKIACDCNQEYFVMSALGLNVNKMPLFHL